MYPGIDPGALWRSREWRRLLNLIDHLPQNTWYQAAVSEDEEHALMVLRAQDAAQKSGRPNEGPPAPSLAIWSPEVDKLATIIDTLRALVQVTIGAGGGKPKEPQSVPRPASAMEVARIRHKQEKHDDLVARMLPSKRVDE